MADPQLPDITAELNSLPYPNEVKAKLYDAFYAERNGKDEHVTAIMDGIDVPPELKNSLLDRRQKAVYPEIFQKTTTPPAAKPKPEGPGILERAVNNAPRSGANLIKGLLSEATTGPAERSIKQVKAVGSKAVEGYKKGGVTGALNSGLEEGVNQAISPVIETVKKIAHSFTSPGESFAEDPFGTVLDIASVVMPTLSRARGVAASRGWIKPSAKTPVVVEPSVAVEPAVVEQAAKPVNPGTASSGPVGQKIAASKPVSTSGATKPLFDRSKAKPVQGPSPAPGPKWKASEAPAVDPNPAPIPPPRVVTAKPVLEPAPKPVVAQEVVPEPAPTTEAPQPVAAETLSPAPQPVAAEMPSSTPPPIQTPRVNQQQLDHTAGVRRAKPLDAVLGELESRASSATPEVAAELRAILDDLGGPNEKASFLADQSGNVVDARSNPKQATQIAQNVADRGTASTSDLLTELESRASSAPPSVVEGLRGIFNDLGGREYKYEPPTQLQLPSAEKKALPAPSVKGLLPEASPNPANVDLQALSTEYGVSHDSLYKLNQLNTVTLEHMAGQADGMLREFMSSGSGDVKLAHQASETSRAARAILQQRSYYMEGTHSPVEYSTRTAPIPGNNPNVGSVIPPSKVNPVSSATRNKPTVPTELEARVMQGYERPTAPPPGVSKQPVKVSPVSGKPVESVAAPAKPAPVQVKPEPVSKVAPVQEAVAQEPAKPSVTVEAKPVEVETVQSKIPTSLEIDPVVEQPAAPAVKADSLPKSSAPPSFKKPAASPSAPKAGQPPVSSAPPKKGKVDKTPEASMTGNKSRSRESEAIYRRVGDRAKRIEPDRDGKITYINPKGETRSVPLSNSIDLYEIDGKTYQVGIDPQHGNYGKMTSLDGKSVAFDVYEEGQVSSPPPVKPDTAKAAKSPDPAPAPAEKPASSPPPVRGPVAGQVPSKKAVEAERAEAAKTMSKADPAAVAEMNDKMSTFLESRKKTQAKSVEPAMEPPAAESPVAPEAAAPEAPAAEKPAIKPLAPPVIPNKNPAVKPVSPEPPIKTKKTIKVDSLSGQELMDVLVKHDHPMARHIKSLLEKNGIDYKPTPGDWKEARMLQESSNSAVERPNPVIEQPGVKYIDSSYESIQSKPEYKRFTHKYTEPRTRDVRTKEYELRQEGADVFLIDSKSRVRMGSFKDMSVEQAYDQLTSKKKTPD